MVNGITFFIVANFLSSYRYSLTQAIITTRSVRFVNQEAKLSSEFTNQNLQSHTAEDGLGRVSHESLEKNANSAKQINHQLEMGSTNTISKDELNGDLFEKSVTSTPQIPISKETAFLEPIVVAPTQTENDRPVSISIFGEIIQPSPKETKINEFGHSGEPEEVEIEMDTPQFYYDRKSFTFYVLFALGTCALVVQIFLFRRSSKATYKYYAKSV